MCGEFDGVSVAPRSMSNCVNTLQKNVMATEIDGTPAWPRPAGRKMPALIIANRHEIAGAGIEALLEAGGNTVVARGSDEHDLLRCAKAYRRHATGGEHEKH